MWAAYILLCRDIELACDEKVIKELGIKQRADYSQALLNCSIDRKSIAACPVAFGEVSVKERVKNVLNYRKPTFWVIVIAIVLCIVAAVCFLTNPIRTTSPYAVTSAIPDTGLFGSAEYLTPGDITGYTFFPEQEEELAAILRSLTQEDFIPAVGITPITKFTLSWKGGEVILYTDGIQVEFGEDARWAVANAELNQFLSQFQQNDYSYENYDDIPLDKIPTHYSLEEATIDKCVIIVDGDVRDNQDVWEEFIDSTASGEEAAVRCVNYSSNPSSEPRMFIFDLTFHGTSYTLRGLCNGEIFERSFQYLHHSGEDYSGQGLTFDAYSCYYLTNNPNTSVVIADITLDIGRTITPDDDTYIVYTDLIYYPDHPAIPGNLTSAALEMDGERFLTITDPAILAELSSMFSNAELMWEPKTYNLGPVLTLTDIEGKTCQIELDVADDLCRIDGHFYDYGPGYNENGGNFALPDLWKLLGLSNWPQRVLEKYAEYLGYSQ